MEEFSTDMTGTVKKAVAERTKLAKLDAHIDHMSGDFERMRSARAAAEQQLSRKFEGVYEDIKVTREYVAVEGQKISQELESFKVQFRGEFSSLRMHTEGSFAIEQTERETVHRGTEDSMEQLRGLISQETIQRVQQTDELLTPIRECLSALEAGFESEKTVRIEREAVILGSISSAATEAFARIEGERNTRNSKLKGLQLTLCGALSTQQSHTNKFQQDSYAAFSDLKEGVSSTMGARLAQQDGILNNFKEFLRTFQSTLKILGKDI